MYERIIGWDTEDDSRGNLVGVCLYSMPDGDFRSFDSAEAFKREIKRAKYRDSLFLAHNSEYDIANIWGVEGLKEFHEYIQLGSQFKYASLPCGSGHYIRFCDTANHARVKLAALGKTMGLEKMEDAGPDRPWAERRDYCMRDAEIVARFGWELQRVYNELGTSLRATVGGSALELYQRKYLTITWRPLKQWALWYFKRAYYGGRTECFRLGRIPGPVYHYDANSLYPSCMSRTMFPHPAYMKYRKNPPPDVLHYEGAAQATVEVPKDTQFPVLPTRTGKLVFPVGTFTGFWPINLLRYAEESGAARILKIHSAMAGRGEYYLKGFSEDLYKARKAEQDPVKKLVYKLLLNNLYGKFAAMDSVQVYNPWTGKFENRTAAVRGVKDQRTVSADPLRLFQNSHPVYVNVIWSAMVTAAGFTTMHPTFRDSTLYTDTDSLFDLREDVPNQGPDLGQFKHEGTYKEVEILLPKFYWTRDADGEIHYTAKGFPSRFTYAGKTEDPARDAFEKGSAKFRKPNRLRESMRRGLKVNEWRETRRSVRACYDKREILEDGRTRPLTVDSIDVK